MERVTIETIPQLAQRVLERIPSDGVAAGLVLLKGELGAGKTTLMQALARELGIKDPIQSPTYVLMKSYPISWGRFTKLVHIDAYRLERPDEFLTLRPEMFLADPHSLVCIEWPERLDGMLPTPDVVVELSSVGMVPEERLVRML